MPQSNHHRFPALVWGFWQDSNLVRKFALLFGLAGFVVAAISFLTLKSILAPTFSSIEAQVNAEQVARARSALAESNTQLLSKALDYAVRDDTYNYALTSNRAFEAEALSPVTYENLNVDYIGIVHADGSVVWSKAVNRASSRFLDAETAEITRQLVSGPFADRSRRQEQSGTIITGSRGLYAIQSTWIRKSDGTGEPNSRLLMGRLLDETDLSNALQTKVNIDLDKSSGRARAIAARPDRTVSTIMPNSIRNALGLVDSEGHLQGIVTFDTRRQIVAAGAKALHSALLVMGLGLATLALVLAFGIHRLSVVPLRLLRQYVSDFHDNRQAIDPALLTSADEIGSLARQFDSLGEELAEAEEELRKQAYLQGKADSAMGLLHNIRNSLGPLGVKYDKWCREDALPLRSQLKLALDELATDGSDEKRRADLENFVKIAAGTLIDMGNVRADEIGDVKESVDQIIAILADYNFNSSATPQMEAVSLRGIILREVRDRETTEGREIVLDMPSHLPPVWGNYIHLSQLIGNLIGNAVDSMLAGDVADMKLRIACQIDDLNGGIVISITDNGHGATQEVISKAFERGFSTRRYKSGGMGLHWSANAARAMGGALSLHSKGIGAGATARLRLPTPPAQITDPVPRLAA